MSLEESSSSFLQQRRASFTLNEITTQIIVTSYIDRHFIIITQIKKFGTLVSSPHLLQSLPFPRTHIYFTNPNLL